MIVATRREFLGAALAGGAALASGPLVRGAQAFAQTASRRRARSSRKRRRAPRAGRPLVRRFPPASVTKLEIALG
jgi:hypothetical protein